MRGRPGKQENERPPPILPLEDDTMRLDRRPARARRPTEAAKDVEVRSRRPLRRRSGSWCTVSRLSLPPSSRSLTLSRRRPSASTASPPCATCKKSCIRSSSGRRPPPSLPPLPPAAIVLARTMERVASWPPAASSHLYFSPSLPPSLSLLNPTVHPRPSIVRLRPRPPALAPPES